MEDYFGKDITKLMQDPDSHLHSKNAYSMLEGYKIGIVKTDVVDVNEVVEGQLPKSWGKVDFRRAILWQVARLGKDYEHWVSTEPVHFKEPVRLFGSDFVERFSRTPWYAIPLTWIPLISLILCLSFNWGKFVNPETVYLHSNLSVLTIYLLGALSWFFLEYYVHKYVYHCDALARVGNFVTNIAHFLLHGMHHKIPMDKDRLVAPHTIQIVIGFPIYCLLFLIFQNHHFCLTAVAGIATSYMYYDVTHYMLHHAPNPKIAPFPFNYLLQTNFFQKLKTHHMIHHFSTNGHLHNMGISNQYVDILLGSLQTKHD